MSSPEHIFEKVVKPAAYLRPGFKAGLYKIRVPEPAISIPALAISCEITIFKFFAVPEPEKFSSGFDFEL